jgi:hypothetical protein
VSRFPHAESHRGNLRGLPRRYVRTFFSAA